MCSTMGAMLWNLFQLEKGFLKKTINFRGFEFLINRSSGINFININPLGKKGAVFCLASLSLHMGLTHYLGADIVSYQITKAMVINTVYPNIRWKGQFTCMTSSVLDVLKIRSTRGLKVYCNTGIEKNDLQFSILIYF